VIGATGFVGARPLIEGLGNPKDAHDDRICGRLPFALTAFGDAALDPARERRRATR
jgi:hypothetical protein